MMYWGNGMGGWGMLLMVVSAVLFWGLLIAGIVVLVRYAGRTGQPAGPAGMAGPAAQVDAESANARRILAERFARGEIDQDEYYRRLEVLGTAAGTPARS